MGHHSRGEPWRIEVVGPLRIASRAGRERAIREAGHDLDVTAERVVALSEIRDRVNGPRLTHEPAHLRFLGARRAGLAGGAPGRHGATGARPHAGDPRRPGP